MERLRSTSALRLRERSLWAGAVDHGSLAAQPLPIAIWTVHVHD